MPSLAPRASMTSLLFMAGVASVSAAQGGLDVTYGRWWQGGPASTVISASFSRPLLGPFSYSLGAYQFRDGDTTLNRTNTGGEVSLAMWPGGGVYGVASAGIGMRHRGGDLDGQWSAGAGYAYRPLSFLQVGVEGRYRVEDQAIHGFWQLDPTDRRGWVLSGRVALSFGGGGYEPARAAPSRGGTPASAAPAAPNFRAPSDETVRSNAASHGASGEAVTVTAKVVRAALDAMGTPYSWGGTDANGFDCSGLIQFAYGSQGLIVPRVSTDQMRTGVAVAHVVDSLRPGDILGFAVEGNRVTHVGLYVGDGTFIHSASGGVKLSSLTSTDPDSEWWRRHWVTVRRIVP